MFMLKLCYIVIWPQLESFPNQNGWGPFRLLVYNIKFSGFEIPLESDHWSRRRHLNSSVRTHSSCSCKQITVDCWLEVETFYSRKCILMSILLKTGCLCHTWIIARSYGCLQAPRKWKFWNLKNCNFLNRVPALKGTTIGKSWQFWR